jgi:hypothetical protein
MSIQDTTGSDIAFAAIVHLGQTLPKKYLRCILDCRDMVSVKTADGDLKLLTVSYLLQNHLDWALLLD